jgi:RNA polymerase sigma-70 factor (ECF subfamily)
MTADSAAVVAEFQRRLRAFVSRRVRHLADVEDVLQDTFLHIHRHLPLLRRADRLTAWVFQVARNAIADHHRRRRRSGNEPSGTPLQEEDQPEELELEELAACLRPMIDALPAPDREAIEMAELRGLTQREASARAGLSLSGMKSRVQRARRKLKDRLLECCRIELDRRGRIVDHEPRRKGCDC